MMVIPFIQVFLYWGSIIQRRFLKIENNIFKSLQPWIL